MNNLENLNPEQLQALIQQAETALAQKQSSKRKEVIAQIKELAASINVTVEIHDEKKPTKRGGSSVADKYVNPADPSQRWSGRGLAPKWMQALMGEGRNKEEFLIAK